MPHAPGYCHHCRHRPATAGSRCEVCLEAHRIDRAAEREQKRLEGICLFSGCQSLQAPGRTLCPKHLERERARWQRRKAKKRAESAAETGDHTQE